MAILKVEDKMVGEKNNKAKYILCEENDDDFIVKDTEQNILLNSEKTVSTLNNLQRRLDYILKHGDDNNFGIILMRYLKSINEIHAEYQNTVNQIRKVFDEYIEDCDDSMKIAEKDEDMLNAYGAFFARSQIDSLISELETIIFQKSNYIEEREEYLWWKDSS